MTSMYLLTAEGYEFTSILGLYPTLEAAQLVGRQHFDAYWAAAPADTRISRSVQPPFHWQQDDNEPNRLTTELMRFALQPGVTGRTSTHEWLTIHTLTPGEYIGAYQFQPSTKGTT